MTFGQKLKAMRESSGLTQEALARAGNMSVGNVRNYEQGIRLPTFPIVVKLAAALDTDCTAFAGCEDVKGEPASPPAKKKPGKK